MSKASGTGRAGLYAAATRVFARYGYRRATMTDIAREAGMSRPALYLVHANKGALLRALAEHLRDAALAAAGAAWRDGARLADGLGAAILAKDLPLYRLLHASPHGAELMDADAALTAEIAAELQAGFAALLAARAAAAARAGAADLDAFGGARGFGETVALLAEGLKEAAADEAAYVAAVRRLCRVVAAAARANSRAG